MLIVVDGRPALAREIAAASPELRQAVRQRLQALLRDPAFEDFLPGAIDPGSPSEGRWEIVLDRLREIAA